MTTIQFESTLKVNTERPIMDLVIRLLYWQGFWFQPPSTDLHVYRKYFKPRLAKPLVPRHCFRFCRPFYATFIMTFLFTHLFVVYPFAIYFYWNKMEAIENTFAILFCFLGLSASATMFFKKEKLFVLVLKLQEMSRCKLFGDEDTKRIIRKTDNICHTITKYVHLVFVPLMSSALAIYACFNLLPKKKMFFRGWFPYDVDVSPAFELTLFVWTVSCILTFCIVNTILCFYCSTFLYIIVYFKIIVSKFIKVRKVTNMNNNMREKPKLKVSGFNHDSLSSRLMVENSRVDFVLDKAIVDEDLESKYAGRNVKRLRHLNMFSQHVEINMPGALEQRDPPGSVSKVTTWYEQRFECGGKGKQNIENALSKRKPIVSERRRDLIGKRHKGRIEGIDKFKESKNLRRQGRKIVEGDDIRFNLQMLNVVKIHQEILRSTSQWFSIMNQQLIVCFLTSMGTLGSTTLLVTSAPSFSMKELFLISLFLEAELMFFIFNLMANAITIEAAAVGEAVYSCDWLRASPVFKKSMLIIMSRANCPLVFKPTGLNPLSRRMFGDVSYTAFKMLSTMSKMFD